MDGQKRGMQKGHGRGLKGNQFPIISPGHGPPSGSCPPCKLLPKNALEGWIPDEKTCGLKNNGESMGWTVEGRLETCESTEAAGLRMTVALGVTAGLRMAMLKCSFE